MHKTLCDRFNLARHSKLGNCCILILSDSDESGDYGESGKSGESGDPGEFCDSGEHGDSGDFDDSDEFEKSGKVFNVIRL